MHESKKWKWSCSVVSDSSRPHGLQPIRLLRPWDFPGKGTGVGCHCLLHIFQFLYMLVIFTEPWTFESKIRSSCFLGFAAFCYHVSSPLDFSGLFLCQMSAWSVNLKSFQVFSEPTPWAWKVIFFHICSCFTMSGSYRGRSEKWKGKGTSFLRTMKVISARMGRACNNKIFELLLIWECLFPYFSRIILPDIKILVDFFSFNIEKMLSHYLLLSTVYGDKSTDFISIFLYLYYTLL